MAKDKLFAIIVSLNYFRGDIMNLNEIKSRLNNFNKSGNLYEQFQKFRCLWC